MTPGSLQGVGRATAHGLEARDVRQRAKALSPIWWLHIPKTGTSLATTLAHYACGAAVPENMTLMEPGSRSKGFLPPGGPSECGGREGRNCTEARWNYRCGRDSFLRFRAAHDPLGDADRGIDFPDDDLRHVATMFRDPMQRAISGWHHRRHSCPGAKGIFAYAYCVRNCQTQMLSGYRCGSRGATPSVSDYDRAERRIPKLGFVGLTSEWDLSVCLFHAMHGGICKPVEFFNTRPGVNRSRSLYNLTEYGLTEDQWVSYDDGLYAEAKKVFWNRIEEYNVTRQSCAELYCRPSKEFFETKLDSARRTKVTKGGMTFKFDWPGRPAYSED